MTLSHVHYQHLDLLSTDSDREAVRAAALALQKQFIALPVPWLSGKSEGNADRPKNERKLVSRGLCQSVFNAEVKALLVGDAWSAEVPVYGPKRREKIDFLKEIFPGFIVGLEAEFGHDTKILNNLARLATMYVEGRISLGVLLLPIKATVKVTIGAGADFETAVRRAIENTGIRPFPLVIIGYDHTKGAIVDMSAPHLGGAKVLSGNAEKGPINAIARQLVAGVAPADIRVSLEPADYKPQKPAAKVRAPRALKLAKRTGAPAVEPRAGTIPPEYLGPHLLRHMGSLWRGDWYPRCLGVRPPFTRLPLVLELGRAEFRSFGRSDSCSD